MNRFVVDTSVTLAWYLSEEFSPSARSWQDRMLSGTSRLLVPSLHYWELENSLRALVAHRVIDPAAARDIVDLHLDAPLEIAEPDRGEVFRLALEYEATVYDAVFIGLALAQDIPLVTAERTTTRWVARLADRIEPVR